MVSQATYSAIHNVSYECKLILLSCDFMFPIQRERYLGRKLFDYNINTKNKRC